MKLGLIVVVLLLVVPACRRESSPDRPSPAEDTARTAINGVTGKTAIDAGKRARRDIENATAKRDTDLDKVME